VRTSDGHITIGGANQRNWERICHAIGRTDLLSDTRFTANPDRMANRTELIDTLEATLATNTMAHWLSVLDEAGVPCGPINDMGKVYADPQVLARNMLLEIEHPTAGTINNVGMPLKLSETPGSVRRPPPLLGQHTDEVLAEFGYSDDDIARLREMGAVR